MHDLSSLTFLAVLAVSNRSQLMVFKSHKTDVVGYSYNICATIAPVYIANRFTLYVTEFTDE